MKQKLSNYIAEKASPHPASRMSFMITGGGANASG